MNCSNNNSNMNTNANENNLMQQKTYPIKDKFFTKSYL